MWPWRCGELYEQDTGLYLSLLWRLLWRHQNLHCSTSETTGCQKGARGGKETRPCNIWQGDGKNWRRPLRWLTSISLVIREKKGWEGAQRNKGVRFLHHPVALFLQELAPMRDADTCLGLICECGSWAVCGWHWLYQAWYGFLFLSPHDNAVRRHPTRHLLI